MTLKAGTHGGVTCRPHALVDPLGDPRDFPDWLWQEISFVGRGCRRVDKSLINVCRGDSVLTLSVIPVSQPQGILSAGASLPPQGKLTWVIGGWIKRGRYTIRRSLYTVRPIRGPSLRGGRESHAHTGDILARSADDPRETALTTLVPDGLRVVVVGSQQLRARSVISSDLARAVFDRKPE